MKGKIMIENLINTNAHHKSSQRRWVTSLSFAALIAFSHFHAQAGFFDKIVKVERNGDSVGVSVNPLGFLGGDKKAEDNNNSSAVDSNQGVAAAIISQVQNQNSGFTQARLPDGAIHLAFIDSPEQCTVKNTRELSKLPLLTELAGGMNYYSSTEVKHFILVHHGFLPSFASADPVKYLISESHTERMRLLNLNQFQERDEAPRVREKFQLGLEQAKGIERGVVFTWTACAGAYDFVSKGSHFGPVPPGLYINGVSVSSVYFPISEAAARASVERKTDYFILKFEGRIMDKDEIPGESRNLNIAVPLAVSKATLYLVRRREDGKTVPEHWGTQIFEAQKTTVKVNSGDFASAPAQKPTASQPIARENASLQRTTTSAATAMEARHSGQPVQISDAQTSREFVESSAWAEFKKTWKQEGGSWTTEKSVVPAAFDPKTSIRQWRVNLVSKPDSGCELKNVKCEIEQKTVPELQRMNGLSDRWVVKFSAEYYRMKSSTGWSEWKSGSRVLVLQFEARDGGALTMLDRTPVWSPK